MASEDFPPKQEEGFELEARELADEEQEAIAGGFMTHEPDEFVPPSASTTTR